MTQKQFQKVEAVFQAACALPGAERPAYIQQACGSDLELQQHVLRLLRHDERPRLELEPASASAVRAVSEEVLRKTELPVPTRIGAYRVIKQIGEGGFGVVYLAEQERPRRTVALKVVRWTMASVDTVKRFEHETHILGQLQHSGIAQIFEAGVADVVFDAAPAGAPPARMPYYTMEYVPGPNLLDYAARPGPDRGPLDVHERLELIARVCDALQHAHQNGIIHRDLKPDNILVIDSTTVVSMTSPSGTRSFGAQPKLLDFGIARVLEADEKFLLHKTGVGQIVGTPAYMSPEQVKGEPHRVDTRSDVYAVGVLLYQLLADRLPYNFPSGNLAEVVRVIESHEPLPLRSAVASRGGRVNVDIEAIVAKALAKEKERRYQSAAELGLDIRRFLADEPIEAKRDSALYLLRKNVKRYRGVLSAAGAFVLLLVVFAVWAGFQARLNRLLAEDATRSESKAIAERDRANKNAERLAVEMSLSNIDRGRALAVAGNFVDAEALIWRELLATPTSPAAYWALREFYARFANRATLHTNVRIIRCLALSPDEQFIAVGGDAYEIEIWEVRSQRRVRTLAGHDNFFLADLAFSPDGVTLASAGFDGRVILWDWVTGDCRQILKPHRTWATSLCFSPDGRYVITGGEDAAICVSDTASGQRRTAIMSGRVAISSARVSPNGRFLGLGTSGGRVELWDLDVLLSADGVGVATPVPPPDDLRIAVFDGHKDKIQCVAFSPDSQTLASSGYNLDRTIRLWNTRTLECDAVLANSVGVMDALLFTADGARLYAGGWFTIDIWDVAARQRTGIVSKGKCAALVMARGNPWIFSGSDHDVRVWDISPTPGLLSLGKQSGKTLAFQPQGQYLATSIGDGSVKLRDPITGEIRREFKPTDGREMPDDRFYRVRSLSYSPAGDEVVSVSWDYILRRWNTESGACTATIKNVDFITHQSVAFSADGTRWGYALRNVTFALQTLAGQEPPKSLLGGTNEALSMAFSSDGKLLATTSREGAVRLWTSAGEPLGRLECRTTPWGLTFSADSRKLYVTTWLFTIQVWDVSSRTLEQTLEGHSATVWGVQFKPDDPETLSSCASDGTVRIWNVTTGRNLAMFEVFPGEETMVSAFSPDSRRIGVASSMNEVRLLNLDYFDRCIIGNLDAQIDRLQDNPASDINVTETRERVLKQLPWWAWAAPRDSTPME